MTLGIHVKNGNFPSVKMSVHQIAKEYALHTRTPLFLTGRAGTGKTTWLKEILEETDKKTVVVAPTGVAAINAGGVTIHSMFQLPMTGFIPTDDPVDPALFHNRHTLAETQKIRKERIEVLLELEMLIIDEISMVRADLLDAIDMVLRRIRKSQQAFGGVQVIVIGDLFQLSPVVKNMAFRTLSQYYNSQYFFDSWVWKRSNAITLELTKIYRQVNASFISILNNIRKGDKDLSNLSLLNERVLPAPKDRNIITLSTHNAAVNTINHREIEALKTEKYNLKAHVSGKFSESAYPVSEQITLKKGCQVMFIRNDSEGLYYNGKIGKVTGKIENEIYVKCSPEEDPIRVAPVEWKNVKYSVDPETKAMNKEEVGTFTQHPLKLAWAVTVHKSQGLTFDEACLDLANTFAPGQLYVALSRCRSMEGLYLTAPVTKENIIVDPKITEYHHKATAYEFSQEHLAQAKAAYEDIKICEQWSLVKLLVYIDLWNEVIQESNLPEENSILKLNHEIYATIQKLNDTADKFRLQVETLIVQYNNDDEVLHTIVARCKKAIHYFTTELHKGAVKPLEQHYSIYKVKGKVKKRYLTVVDTLVNDLWLQMDHLYKMKYRSIVIHPDAPEHKRAKMFNPHKKRKKKPKGETFKITLDLLNEDKSIEEIAKIRSLAASTIEGHIDRLLKDDKINIDQIMNHERRDRIISYFTNNPDTLLSDLRPKIPFDISFGEMRWIQTYLKKHLPE